MAISDDDDAIPATEQFQFGDDPIETIKWKNGIGFLNKSDLHFQFNEFGLVEVVDDVEFKRYMEQEKRSEDEKPLYERQADNSKNRLHQMIKENERIFKCKRCYSYGLAKEFYTQDFCSIICFNDMNKLQDNSKQLSEFVPAVESGEPDPLVEKPTQKCQQCLKTAAEFYNDDFCSIHCEAISNFDNAKPSLKLLEHNLPTKKIKIKEEIKVKSSDDVSAESLTRLSKFCWSQYLSQKPYFVASKKLFNPWTLIQVEQLKSFSVGDKLEVIDPENQSCISVCTVVEKKGFRIKIHFDGYPKAYDFWTNSNSLDLLPPGFCSETFRSLRPPLNYKSKFDWRSYVVERGGQLANPESFAIKRVINFENQFKVGMKLEADDLKNSDKICVATVRDVMGPRLLIHFDEWDDVYDYWVDHSSPYIHPINWHKNIDVVLTTPPGYTHFSWSKYLKDTKSVAASNSLFGLRKPCPFKIGMKLEAVDNRVPFLIRPATVVAVDEFEIRVHYDGWPEVYGTWFKDDSFDIYPVKYSQKNGHDVEFPPNFGPPHQNECGTEGCRGFGNAINFEEPFHRRHEECPYDIKNYLKSRKLMNRLEYHVKQMKTLNE